MAAIGMSWVIAIPSRVSPCWTVYSAYARAVGGGGEGDGNGAGVAVEGGTGVGDRSDRGVAGGGVVSTAGSAVGSAEQAVNRSSRHRIVSRKRLDFPIPFIYTAGWGWCQLEAGLRLGGDCSTQAGPSRKRRARFKMLPSATAAASSGCHTRDSSSRSTAARRRAAPGVHSWGRRSLRPVQRQRDRLFVQAHDRHRGRHPDHFHRLHVLYPYVHLLGLLSNGDDATGADVDISFAEGIGE